MHTYIIRNEENNDPSQIIHQIKFRTSFQIFKAFSLTTFYSLKIQARNFILIQFLS